MECTFGEERKRLLDPIDLRRSGDAAVHGPTATGAGNPANPFGVDLRQCRIGSGSMT